MRFNRFIKCVLFAIWGLGTLTLAIKYDWKAGALCWLISCAFGTAVMLEADNDDKSNR